MLRADSVDLDEPPFQDLHCLQIQLFSSQVLEELRLRRVAKHERVAVPESGYIYLRW